MKKSFILTAIIAVVIFMVSGCSSSEGTTKNTENIPQLYYAGQDTLISSQYFTLSPFTKEYCGKIVNGRYWNPTGFKNDSLQMQGDPVPADSIKKWFGNPDPFKEMDEKNNASFYGMPKWFQDLFWWLLALLMVGVGLLILFWAFQIPDRRRPNTTTSSSQNSSTQNNRSAKYSSFGTEDYDGAVSIINALKKGETGGTVNLGNAVEIHIPSGPEVNIWADNGSVVAGVDVHIHSGGNAYGEMGTVHHHEGDDQREFHRQSGQKERPASGSEKKEEGN